MECCLRRMTFLSKEIYCKTQAGLGRPGGHGGHRDRAELGNQDRDEFQPCLHPIVATFHSAAPITYFLDPEEEEGSRGCGLSPQGWQEE